ncbi:hypothetical protein GCM10012275_61330 [Longimycelium tulufanense]|uniref:Bacteriocin biosynthesis cyclodehydratase domain-containing protein n=1 Tax=Longimycelium tulufanense TaxID=907463 RepID=A0A8J3FZP5_9PSEU|nr:TOMM precursor leader peptide-binding protein [Longimycelium tulufanense]GGM82504.1 hypothetical protein GCM10012275_61330 [Longimycelium tulufanense]
MTSSAPGGDQPPSVELRATVNPGARIEVTDEAVLIREGDHIVRLAGGRLPAFTEALLTALADGQPLNVGQPDPERRAALNAVLNQLAEAGLLQLDDAATDLEQARGAAVGLWLRALHEIPLRTIDQRLGEGVCTVLGSGTLVQRLVAGLRGENITVVAARDPDAVPVTDDPERDVVVAVGRDENDPLLTEWNTCALESGRTWLAVFPFDGRRAIVGPWILPGASACLTCFQVRRAAAFPDRPLTDDLLAARPVATSGDRGAVYPGITTMQVGIVMERILEWFGLTSTHAGLATPGGLHTLDAGREGLQLAKHRVLRVPRCPTCSTAQGVGYPMVWSHPLPAIQLPSHTQELEQEAGA